MSKFREPFAQPPQSPVDQFLRLAEALAKYEVAKFYRELGSERSDDEHLSGATINTSKSTNDVR